MAQEIGMTMAFGAATLASLAGRQAVGCWRSRQRKLKLEKQLESALVLSCGTGKTRLCETLEGHGDVKVLDLKELVNRRVHASKVANVGGAAAGVLAVSDVKVSVHEPSDIERMIAAKEIYDTIKSSLPNYKLVVVCDTIEEAKYLGIPEESTIVCTPCEKLFTEQILKGKTLEERELIVKKRLQLISRCSEEVINKFSSFDELYGVIKTAYKLTTSF